MNKPFDMRLIGKIDKEFVELRRKYGANIPDEEYDKIYKKFEITEDDQLNNKKYVVFNEKMPQINQVDKALFCWWRGTLSCLRGTRDKTYRSE
jgi:hypothetical protein